MLLELTLEITAVANINVQCMLYPTQLPLLCMLSENHFKTTVQELEDCVPVRKSNLMLLWLKAGPLAT